MTRESHTTVDAEAIERLRGIVGGANVLVSAEGRETYATDETEELRFPPEVVVKADTADQVSAVLRLANEKGFPVTPRTGGTGVTGGALAVRGGVVLTLERMDRILEIDRDNFSAVVQPGVITGNLQRAVEDVGLFYPPDPASLDSCTIGGNVAECAGGPRALKWGVTRNFVTGLEVVFPTGGIARLGGKLRKNVTGYDLIGLMVGSEGTLGVVTEITLRLLPKPSHTADLLVPFSTLAEAATTVARMVRGNDVPAVVEFMDDLCTEAAARFLKREVPFPGAEAQLLIQLAGSTEAEVSGALERVGKVCLDGGARDVLVASSASMRERIWEMRRQLREALLARCKTKFSEDVAVPPAVLPELIRRLKALGKEASIEVACFGHVGDGNIHANVLQGSLSERAWREGKPGWIRRVLEIAVELGGTLTGEHGIGCTKREFLDLALPGPAREAMRAIKKALDPAGILNPGKAI
ncbi:MAG: FAD-binding oxidoreductase [Planctomycetota bacterium]|jgi:glycolate oxidase